MSKIYIIGKTISMDAESYNKFVSLTKDEQVDRVYNLLSPKNREQAEDLLKDVPHAENISKGGDKPSAKTKPAAHTGASEGSSDARPETDNREG